MVIKNKRIVITGASSGIGLLLLKNMALIEGVRIVAVGRKTEYIPAANNIYPYTCDISIQQEVDNLFTFSIDKMGGIDIFVANAGFGIYEKLNIPNWNHISSIFSTNVFSPIYSLLKMIELNPINEFSVVATDSVLGKMVMPGYSLYTSTKHALDGFCSCIQHELPGNGHLITIYPVATYTDFFTRAAPDSDMPRPYQKPDKVVRAIINGILKDKKRVFPYPAIRFILPFINTFPFLTHSYYKRKTKRLEQWYKQTTEKIWSVVVKPINTI